MKKDNKMKNIRNRFIAIISLLLFITTPIQAQVFIMDEDQGGNIRVEEMDFVIPVPYQAGDLDEYIPIGEGLFLLSGLGTSYLLRKRKKEYYSPESC